ncbi:MULTISPECIES: hypothetical protein [Metabacillus]|uniref:hypothetical protein n=1 Tax=Metabacillus TaxID=2675233 RepID=UPI000C807B02|nr:MULTISPECIES: hypothetical protein [Metabacillus]MCM3443981.1 hypothetical protein [Metabacillus halosaccharovorans]PMC34965.1 hypothetical protein CJ195_20885 [Bacillus sp. UMB0899]
MFPVDKNNIQVKRYREHLKEQVERYRNIGKTEDDIIYWIENVLDKEKGMSVSNNFDSTHELANFLNLPVSKFNVFWM